MMHIFFYLLITATYCWSWSIMTSPGCIPTVMVGWLFGVLETNLVDIAERQEHTLDCQTGLHRAWCSYLALTWKQKLCQSFTLQFQRVCDQTQIFSSLWSFWPVVELWNWFSVSGSPFLFLCNILKSAEIFQPTAKIKRHLNVSISWKV